ncbi:hypothetical protein B0H13DRAFT_1980134 [Mycena leptocephala]|nr:hypothetical protein B0H13DRAFT_1980134 [Mycena leptocephala]
MASESNSKSVRVAGATIEGHVDLHVPLALKDGVSHLRIEMRETLSRRIRIYQKFGQVVFTRRENVFSLTQSLWTSGSAKILSDVLSCPFRFTLPENPSSSCCYSKYPPPETPIRYTLEVVGHRPGIFRADRRIRRVLLVTPAASQSQIFAKEDVPSCTPMHIFPSTEIYPTFSEFSTSAGEITCLDGEVSPASAPPSYLDATTTSQIVSGQNHMTDTRTDTLGPAKRRVAAFLGTLFKVKLSGRPMDILWWILLGILSILVGVLSGALAIVWSRVH